MKTTKIYEDYTHALTELNELQAAYRNLRPDGTKTDRADLQKKIDTSRKRLTSIMEQLIQANPFLRRERITMNGMDE